jgi:hypothetical protein
MDVLAMTVIFHPGDLSTWELLGIIGVAFALLVLPIAIIGFIIYRVVAGHSHDSDTVTLSLNESRPSRL